HRPGGLRRDPAGTQAGGNRARRRTRRAQGQDRGRVRLVTGARPPVAPGCHRERGGTGMTWYRDLSPVLAEGVHGIAFPVAGDAPGASVSYPEAGHGACFDIEDASFWFRHRNEAISAMVRRHPPDGLLLDVGGGNGYVAQRLVRDGWPVALLEPGVQGATNARLQRGLERV